MSAAFGRRVLTPDLVEGLIREWKLHTRNGRDKRGLREAGELHVYLGWTEHELAAYRMGQACPQGEPALGPVEDGSHEDDATDDGDLHRRRHLRAV